MGVPRGLRAAALAAVPVVLIGGCGSSHPGAAADLDGYQIQRRSVDEQADVLCSVGPTLVLGAPEGDKVDGRTFRTIVLGVQVQLRQAELGAQELGLEVPSQEGTADDLETVGVDIDSLEQSEVDALLAFSDDNSRVRALIGAISERLAEDTGAVDQELADKTVQFLESQVDDVDVDPRLQLDADLTDAAVSGSLSVPVSEGASAPAADDTAGTQAFVSGLPAQQICG